MKKGPSFNFISNLCEDQSKLSHFVPTSPNYSTMDTPLANRIFRRLFAHETCSVLRSARLRTSAHQTRCYAITPSRSPRPKSEQKPVSIGDLKDTTAWNKRSEFFQDDITDEYLRYPAVTADMLRTRRTRPLRVKMLLKDFIEGADLTF